MRRDLGAQHPILVTGIPRSGTTWVGRMLTASGQVGYINEPFNVESSAGTVRLPVEDWYTYVAPENEERVLSSLVDLLNFRYPLRRELMRSRSRTDVHHTIKMWLTSLRSRGRRPLVKEPHAVFALGWFVERLRSDVVVTVRHPAAVVSSWKRLDWDFDFLHLLRQPALMRDWLEPFRVEMESARSKEDLVGRVALLWLIIYSVVHQFSQRYADLYVVRHEDMSRDPLGQYGKLYDALGLSFTTRAVTAVRSSSASDNPTETSIAAPHLTRIDSVANLENWKSRLTADEIRRIRLVTEPISGAYYTDGDWR